MFFELLFVGRLETLHVEGHWEVVQNPTRPTTYGKHTWCKDLQPPDETYHLYTKNHTCPLFGYLTLGKQ